MSRSEAIETAGGGTTTKAGGRDEPGALGPWFDAASGRTPSESDPSGVRRVLLTAVTGDDPAVRRNRILVFTAGSDGRPDPTPRLVYGRRCGG